MFAVLSKMLLAFSLKHKFFSKFVSDGLLGFEFEGSITDGITSTSVFFFLTIGENIVYLPCQIIVKKCSDL